MWPVSSARPLRRVSCSRSSVRRGGCQERGGTEFSAPPFFVCRSCGSSPAALRRFFGSFPAVLRRFFVDFTAAFLRHSDPCRYFAAPLRFSPLRSCCLPLPVSALFVFLFSSALFPSALLLSPSFRPPRVSAAPRGPDPETAVLAALSVKNSAINLLRICYLKFFSYFCAPVKCGKRITTS